MIMNEHEIHDAADRYRLHPVLGPATQTLVNLLAWTNANSDGWPYWRKPSQAARQLMELIGGMREYLDDPDRADVTEGAYKLTLRPVKAFRTRQAAEHGLVDRETLFVIFEPGADTGGEVWVAQLAVDQAKRTWQAQVTRAEAARLLLDRAQEDLEAAQGRKRLADVRADAAAGILDDPASLLARLAAFDVGDLLWVLPEPGETGPGETARVTGLTYRSVGAVLTYQTAAGRRGNAYHPKSLADARAAYWVLTPERDRIVAGGWPDQARVARVQADRYPDHVVLAGREFMPDPAAPVDPDAVEPGDRLTWTGPGTRRGDAGTVEYTTSEAAHVRSDGGYLYPIPWHRVTSHTPRTRADEATA